MSGETEKDVSSWTVDSLKSHLLTLREADARLLDAEVRRLDQKIEYEAKLSEERDRRYGQRFADTEKRNEQRFQAQEAASVYMRQMTNEFRGQLSDQATTFITRTESLARAQSNADKIDALATRIDRTEGRSGGLSAGWGYVVGAVGLVGALIGIFYALSK